LDGKERCGGVDLLAFLPSRPSCLKVIY
jgi:hypothetical protein